MKKGIIFILILMIAFSISACGPEDTNTPTNPNTPTDPVDPNDPNDPIDEGYPDEIDFEVAGFIDNVNIPQEAKDFILRKEYLEIIHYDADLVVLKENTTIYVIEEDEDIITYENVIERITEYGGEYHYMDYDIQNKVLTYFYDDTIKKLTLETGEVEEVHRIPGRIRVFNNRVVHIDDEIIDYNVDGTSINYGRMDALIEYYDFYNNEFYYGGLQEFDSATRIYLFNTKGAVANVFLDEKIDEHPYNYNFLDNNSLLIPFDDEAESVGHFIIDLQTGEYEKTIYNINGSINHVDTQSLFYRVVYTDVNSDVITKYYTYDNIEFGQESTITETGYIHGFTDEYIYGYVNERKVIERKSDHTIIHTFQEKYSFGNVHPAGDVLFLLGGSMPWAQGALFQQNGTIIRENLHRITKIDEDNYFYYEYMNDGRYVPYVYNLSSNSEIRLGNKYYMDELFLIIEDGYIALKPSASYDHNSNYPNKYDIDIYKVNGTFFDTYSRFSHKRYSIWVNSEGEVIIG